MKKTIPILIMTLLSATVTLTCAMPRSASPIVRVISTYQQDNPYFPWQKLKPGVKYGFGVAIDSSHILTTENLVRNQTLIEIRRPESGRKITATLVTADIQLDLALLKVADSNLLAGIDFPQIADHLPLNSDVKITQIDETSGIQQGEGRVVKAFVDTLPAAPYSLLQYDILSGLNVTGEGAPVFYDKRLAGLMLSYRSSSRTGKMVPAMFISRFIHDTLSGQYPGTATAGFSWKPLVDPVKRKFLGVTEKGLGVLITNRLNGNGTNSVIQPNDVILAWNGHAIDNLGYYQDSEFGRLLFPHLVKGKCRPGDKAKVRIVRDKQVKDVEITLYSRSEADDLIPENTEAVSVPYIVTGGIIIQELTGRMLRSVQNWQTRMDPLLVHLYMTKQHNPDHPGDRIVIFTRTLNDPINIGYQDISTDIIERVNGKPIHNIKDVFKIIDEEGGIKSLSLHDYGVDIELDQQKLEKADRRIRRQYRLPALERRPDEI